ncbi:MAG: ABC transporter substrate-binding protein [Actinomycetota bacterium]
MKKFHHRRLAGFTIAVATLAGVAVGCGGDSSSTPATPAPTADSGAAGPQRILSLSPTHTEILFAIGAGDQVVAVDSLSNFPSVAAAVLTDLSAYEPNVEAISEFDPDLVVIGDDFTGLAEQLEAIGIDAWTSPAPVSLEEVYVQIADLGDRVGRSDEASALVEEMRTAIDEAVAAAPEPTEPLTYYHELDDMYYTVTSNTFIGSLYGLFGLRNIADAAEGSSDYPQLSAEFIVSQNPQLVFLADTKCCAVTAASVATRPGWESLAAVVDGQVVELDDDIASRWGPRVVDYVRAIAAAVTAALA